MTTLSQVEIDGTEYDILKSTDVISNEGRLGTKHWQGHVLRGKDGRFHTATSSWRDLQGGGTSKVVWSKPYYATPTNVGRANEKNNEEQAYFDLQSMLNKQTDKRLAERPLPMLAQTYHDPLNPKKGRKKHIKFPALCQPKYDGMRVLYNGEAAWSRGNKEVIPEVFAHLEFDTQGETIDGELVLPDNPKVNETMKAAKKYRPGVSDKLVYRVYDIVDPTTPFGDRFERLRKIVEMAGNVQVILAHTEVVHSEADIMRFHENVTAQGFEGTIIRNMDAVYEIDKRSNNLQKYKDFVDAEFEIVDIVEAGGGSSEGVGKFICRTEDGDLFESTATGTLEERREFLTNKQNYIGRFAKVKYREMSGKNNVPFHSNVLEIRDRGDF